MIPHPFGRKHRGKHQQSTTTATNTAWQLPPPPAPVSGGYISGGYYVNTTGIYTGGIYTIHTGSGGSFVWTGAGTVVPEIPEPMPGAPPDIVGTVRGYRTWAVWPDGLHSTGNSYRWSEGPLTAICAGNSQPQPFGHAAPAVWCGCGFYAFHDAEAMSMIFHDPLVSGVVEMWGNIIVHEEGFRAEHAKIVAAHIREPRGRIVELCYVGGRKPTGTGAVETESPTGKDVAADFTYDFGREITPAEIQSCYPGVAWYGSRQAMLSDYPPTPL